MKTAILGLTISLGILTGTSNAAELPAPDFTKLDDATISALDTACASWVMTERKANLQPWIGAIGPLCEAARNRPVQPVAAEPGFRASPAASAPAANGLGDKLQQLKALLDQGLITQDDYDKTKAKLLTGFAN
ncbi:MAG: SHOCT domain-containing protein [Nisaea sp.]|uniref:SHOCT domain-containing protein n=1 Tax=Nisaea sp. TaxID=2024842 RepID=UPI001B098176|nr:SHOCT domain-containing protein [Nisaea sp.]MBO6562104.1 SHOCT domain-containing protein [Nisaea sp.]